MNKIVIECQQLSKIYYQGDHSLTVLDSVDLQVKNGERLAIIGSSGSGKTTLLNLLGSIDNPTQGKVLIEGRDVSSLNNTQQDELRNRALGFVYQFHHLLGEFTALENVAMPLIIAGLDFAECMDRAKKFLVNVGLQNRMEHKPAELSGGERQRVAIARALVNNPACVLMDEPTGNLDRHTAHAIHELMHALNQELNISFIIVTHDQQLARQMDRVLYLEDGKLHPWQETTEAAIPPAGHKP